MNLRFSNETYDCVDSQTEEFEDRTYVNPMTDNLLHRTNPPRYDKRKDFINVGEDDEIAGRDNQTNLMKGSKLSWKVLEDITQSKTSSLHFSADLADITPGFIPTNNGMQTPEDIVDTLEYQSYKANREYDRYVDPYSKELNPNYDFEKSRIKWRNFWIKYGKWSDDKLDKFERKYYNEMGGN